MKAQTSLIVGEDLGKVVTVTSDEARELLENTTFNNRHLNQHRVRYLAAQINEGKWRCDLSPILVGEKGVIDGQHRLRALIQSDYDAILMWIRKDVYEHAAEVVDTGKKRTMADLLRLDGIIHGNDIAAALRLLHSWEKSELRTLTTDSDSFTPARMRDLYDEYEFLGLDDMAGATRRKAKGSPFKLRYSVVNLLKMIVVGDEKADEFVEELFLGSTNTTIRTYQRHLQAINEGRFRAHGEPHLQALKLFKVWNAWLDGRTIHSLKVGRVEKIQTPRMS